MVELLIALSVIAVIAGLTIPKLLGGAGDAELKTRMRQAFTLVGESFNSRKKDDAFAPIAGNEALEPLTFYRFLYQNTNFIDGIDPSAIPSAASLCASNNYITYHNGTVLRSICTYGFVPPVAGPPAIPAIPATGLTITVRVPVNANTTTDMIERIMFNSDNYTTSRGFGINTGQAPPPACTMADKVLNVDPSCP